MVCKNERGDSAKSGWTGSGAGSNGWKRPWFADTGRVTEFSVALSALTAWNTDGPFDEPGDEAGYDFLDGKAIAVDDDPEKAR